MNKLLSSIHLSVLVWMMVIVAGCHNSNDPNPVNTDPPAGTPAFDINCFMGT